MNEPPAVHASCAVVGETGILIRGASGTGKSTLARRLVEAARRDGRHAALVADDRVRLAAAGGRLVGRPVPAIAGLLEVRGLGILRTPYEPAARIRLVVDCLTALPERMPEDADLWATVEGIRLPRLALRVDEAGVHLVLARLVQLESSGADTAVAE